MYMYPSTRMLARSQAPHTFTYISFGYDMLTMAHRRPERFIVPWYSSDYLISYFPPYNSTAVLPA